MSDDVPVPNVRPQRMLDTLERLLAIEATTIGPALTEASQLLSEVLASEKVDVFLYDAGSSSLVAIGTSNTPLGRLQHARGLDRLPLANGGRAVGTYRSGQPFLCGHTDEDPEEVVGIKQELGIRSSLLVALEVQGQRRGVVSVVSPEPERFDPTDIPFVEATARWIGSLTHRIELTEQLRKEATAQARQQTADELITVLAHDLRTPLTPLFGWAEMIRATAERDGQSKYAKASGAILRGLSRLRQMTSDLLDTSRLEHGLLTLDPQPIDLVALALQSAASAGIPETALVVQTPNSLPTVGDPARLQQALENLLSNARRFSPPDASITLRIASDYGEEGRRAVVTVSDRGPGISHDLLPRLFTRFGRGSTSGGLGLGLYLAHGIAAAHGGTLTVESSPGVGTTFRLALPLAG